LEMGDAEISAALGLGGDNYDATQAYLYPYQEVLTRDNYKKVDAIEEKFRTNLDEKIQLWVQDSNEIDPNDPDEPERIPFVINATGKTTIDEIRAKIKLECARIELYDEATDGPLRLVYEGKTLTDGTALSDYPVNRARKKWKKPYGGIVWIAPRHLEPNHKRDWGSHQSLAQRKDIIPDEWAT